MMPKKIVVNLLFIASLAFNCIVGLRCVLDKRFQCELLAIKEKHLGLMKQSLKYTDHRCRVVYAERDGVVEEGFVSFQGDVATGLRITYPVKGGSDGQTDTEMLLLSDDFEAHWYNSEQMGCHGVSVKYNDQPRLSDADGKSGLKAEGDR